MVGAFDNQSEGPWFEPGLFRRYSKLSLFTQVYKWVPAIIMLEGNPAMV